MAYRRTRWHSQSAYCYWLDAGEFLGYIVELGKWKGQNDLMFLSQIIEYFVAREWSKSS